MGFVTSPNTALPSTLALGPVVAVPTTPDAKFLLREGSSPLIRICDEAVFPGMSSLAFLLAEYAFGPTLNWVKLLLDEHSSLVASFRSIRSFRPRFLFTGFSHKAGNILTADAVLIELCNELHDTQCGDLLSGLIHNFHLQLKWYSLLEAVHCQRAVSDWVLTKSFKAVHKFPGCVHQFPDSTYIPLIGWHYLCQDFVSVHRAKQILIAK